MSYYATGEVPEVVPQLLKGTSEEDERLIRLDLAMRETKVRESEGYWSKIQGIAIALVPIAIPLAAFLGVKEFFGGKK